MERNSGFTEENLLPTKLGSQRLQVTSFRNGLDLPCFLGFDKPPILKRKTQFPSFQG